MPKAPSYCYWSISTSEYADQMQACVDSARSCGVFKDFHILTNTSLEGCECYDLMDFQAQEGLFPVFYLKLAMSRLNYDYFIWLDADTRFVSVPENPLGPARHSPLHAPLSHQLPEEPGSAPVSNSRKSPDCERMLRHGLPGPVYACETAFWIVHHDAVELVYDLTRDYWQKTRGEASAADFAEAFGFAVQILCADPTNHLLTAWPRLWEQAGHKERLGEASGTGNAAILHFNKGHSLRRPLIKSQGGGATP
ncbi:MAG: hypothetical protein M2R45_05202 [Verrucomicrobia subdivision 3 bacterium]|nr:hypothetical protein [Limisphaerales bacterium]MCS1413894.1 hypothetical protein [Limisphaerales bacterium]